MIWDLAELRFVEAGTRILVLGNSGCGKSHLAIAPAPTVLENPGNKFGGTLADDAGIIGTWTSRLGMYIEASATS